MKTIIKTLLVAVTVLFSVNVAAKTIKLPAGIKYVNSTDEFYCTEIAVCIARQRICLNTKVTDMFSLLN